MDAGFIDHKEKKVITVEMSCPWMDNGMQKHEEKTRKYEPQIWELKQQYPGYCKRHDSIVIDVLGG